MDDLLKLIPIAVGLAGLFLTWRKWREDSYRRNEVAAWANEVIAALEGLVVVCILLPRGVRTDKCQDRLLDIAFNTATLIERGRIFFRNQPVKGFGEDKKPAYRGYRPKVLDPIVAAHQVAVRLLDGPDENTIALQCIAEDGVKDFVSLIQMEIGRSRTASAETANGGYGFNLNRAIEAVPAERIAHIRMLAGRDLGRYREQLPGTRLQPAAD